MRSRIPRGVMTDREGIKEWAVGEGRFGIFTIGHSNHTLEHFLHLLEEPGIEVVVDVRSVPRSAYAPYFDQAPLRRALEERGIRYLYLGADWVVDPTATRSTIRRVTFATDAWPPARNSDRDSSG